MLNGRSASICWSCDADLLSLGRLGAAAPAMMPLAGVAAVAERRANPAPSAVALTDSPRGLHLVSRAGDPASVRPAVDAEAPPKGADLPVLTAFVEGTGPASAPVRRRLRRTPMLAVALGAVVLVGAAAALRWHAPAPQAARSAVSTQIVSAARAEEARARPFAEPVSVDPWAPTRLSFPPAEVLPGDAGGKRTVSVAGRTNVNATMVTRKRGATRTMAAPEGLSLPSKPCSANMAALGFCTLATPSATE